MSLPPDLRVLCRRLTSTPPGQLPHAIPALVHHVLRCKDVLSTPQDPKARGDAHMLVSKLKTIIKAHLTGKNAAGRFVGAVLAKTVVDVGGWESLHETKPWVQALLSNIQKNDPIPVKEVSLVALVRICSLAREHQTLARDIATPAIEPLFKSCLSLLKQSQAPQKPKLPFSFIETVVDAFATLQPLFPTTCRPFNAQVRAAIRPYLAPTSSDLATVPQSLQRACRRLAISLHFNTTGKTGPSEEWAKLVKELLSDFHASADQTFRAVQETWEPLVPRTKAEIALDSPPHVGDAADGLTGWSGVRAGGERLVGLLRFMADALRYPTKAPVTIPVGQMMEIVHRVAQVSKSSRSQTWEQSLETHPAVGREEKEELWGSMPSVHIAALELLHVLCRRLEQNALSLVPESLDSILLVLKSGIDNPKVRAATYTLMTTIVAIAGPGLTKPATDAMGVAMLACCRDLQQDSGHLVPEAKPGAKPAKGPDGKKSNGGTNSAVTANADLFLPTKPGENGDANREHQVSLSRDHRAAAEAFLAGLLMHLPQRQLKPGIRGLLDQTAILSQSRDAMLASVLNPYVNEAGRAYPSIMPHLSRRFPHDQGVEVLRSNIRAALPSAADDLRLAAGFEAVDEDEDMVEEMEEEDGVDGEGDHDMGGSEKPAAAKDTIVPEADTIVVAATETPRDGPFITREATSIVVATDTPPVAQKRKLEDEGATTPPLKKQETETKANVVPVVEAAPAAAADDSDDESVHLNMDLDDLDDEDDDE